jgi:hypothetical protein
MVKFSPDIQSGDILMSWSRTFGNYNMSSSQDFGLFLTPDETCKADEKLEWVDGPFLVLEKKCKKISGYIFKVLAYDSCRLGYFCASPSWEFEVS